MARSDFQSRDTTRDNPAMAAEECPHRTTGASMPRFAHFDEWAYRLIAAQRNNIPNPRSCPAMAAAGEDGDAFDDREIRDQIITLFSAGTESTANLVAWALHLLGSHPHARDRLAVEIDTVLVSGRLPTPTYPA